MFHCFNISRHISISVLFCGVFAEFLKIIAPGLGFWYDFSATGVGVSHFLCARGGGGEFALSKTIPGGMVRLGID